MLPLRPPMLCVTSLPICGTRGMFSTICSTVALCQTCLMKPCFSQHRKKKNSFCCGLPCTLPLRPPMLRVTSLPSCGTRGILHQLQHHTR